jgi:hypothetical protein
MAERDGAGGPRLTKEMVWCMAIGAAIALPLAFLPLGSIGLGARLLVAVLLGAAGGATLAFLAEGLADQRNGTVAAEEDEREVVRT